MPKTNWAVIQNRCWSMITGVIYTGNCSYKPLSELLASNPFEHCSIVFAEYPFMFLNPNPICSIKTSFFHICFGGDEHAYNIAQLGLNHRCFYESWALTMIVLGLVGTRASNLITVVNMVTAPIEVRRFQRFWKWAIVTFFSSSCETP
jgi:hypothetical protein